jgi:dephospho-CoA kinase
MLRVGLTGGIASGKSTVAAMMRDLGCTVLDADALAHRLMEPGQPAYDEVVREFGSAILRPDGNIDRSALASIVFNDSSRLERLNRIVHPRVIEAQDRQLTEMEFGIPRGIVIVEAALLIEAGYHKNLDRLVVAWCRPEQQVERLRARGLGEEESRRRIAAQLPVEEKLRMADHAIDCSVSLEETQQQVTAVIARLNAEAAMETLESGPLEKHSQDEYPANQAPHTESRDKRDRS